MGSMFDRMDIISNVSKLSGLTAPARKESKRKSVVVHAAGATVAVMQTRMRKFKVKGGTLSDSMSNVSMASRSKAITKRTYFRDQKAIPAKLMKSELQAIEELGKIEDAADEDDDFEPQEA